MIKAVIFDFDGTIGDTMMLCVEAFKRAIAPLYGKAVTDADIIATFGPSEEGTVMQLIPDKYEEGLRGYWEWYEKLHDTCPEPFAGMVEILDILRDGGIKLALVTGKAEKSALISLERYGILHYFAALGYGSPEGPCKDIRIKEVLERLGVEPGEAIYIGDAPSDVDFSRMAGVRIAAAAWAKTADDDALAAKQPDEIFRTVEDFRKYVVEAIVSGSSSSAG